VASIDITQLGVAAYLAFIGETMYAAILFGLVLPQMYAQINFVKVTATTTSSMNTNNHINTTTPANNKKKKITMYPSILFGLVLPQMYAQINFVQMTHDYY